jgi:hypothetical protein
MLKHEINWIWISFTDSANIAALGAAGVMSVTLRR